MHTEAVWQAFKERLRGFVTRKVQRPEDVEDVLQDVFLRIHRHLGALKQRDRLTSWIFQITRNSIMDLHRSRRSTDDPFEEEVHGPQGSPVEDATSEALRDLAACLRPMMDTLEAPYRDALVQVDLEGRTHAEAAEAAGISLSGMKSRVQRARRQLRANLEACCRVEQGYLGEILDFAARPGQATPCNDCSGGTPTSCQPTS